MPLGVTRGSLTLLAMTPKARLQYHPFPISLKLFQSMIAPGGTRKAREACCKTKACTVPTLKLTGGR
jgi:hypothetical protein